MMTIPPEAQKLLDAAQWQPMSSAPHDGTEIQARIPGHGSDNVIAWTDTLMNSDEEPCGGWQFTRDQEPPECWSAGICWESNEDEIQSVQPTEWKPLPPNTDTGETS